MSKKTTREKTYISINSISEFIKKSNKILDIENIEEKIKQAKSLSLKIKKLLQNERPSLHEIHSLRGAYSKLQTIISTTKQLPNLFINKNIDSYSYEVMGDLFFLAEKLYFGNKEEFLTKYHLLDEDTQNGIHPFLQYTQGSLQIIQSTSNLCEFTKHSIRVTQAIIGYVHVVTDSWVINPIPTKKEVDILFSEIKNLKKL